MSPVERVLNLTEVFAAIDNLDGKLPPYRRMDPEDRTREVQKAAFGDDAREITEAQYDELIGSVRRLRPWLRENGKKNIDHPDFKSSDHEIFWLDQTGPDSSRYSISFEPKPWGQSALHAKYEEPYPKFSLAFEDQEWSIEFSINFDDTYELRIKSKGLQTKTPFEASGLKRKHMTANEYEVVKHAIEAVTSHFGIPVSVEQD